MSDPLPTFDQSPWRWPRVLVIAMAALILASCRSITQPLTVPLAAAAVTPTAATAAPTITLTAAAEPCDETDCPSCPPTACPPVACMPPAPPVPMVG
ncbi:MAG: hypothetical protein ACKOHK_12845, partial [Planctomycetia bacterium]